MLLRSLSVGLGRKLHDSPYSVRSHEYIVVLVTPYFRASAPEGTSSGREPKPLLCFRRWHSAKRACCSHQVSLPFTEAKEPDDATVRSSGGAANDEPPPSEPSRDNDE